MRLIPAVNNLKLFGHFGVDALCKLLHRHGSLLSTALLTHGNKTVGSLFLAHNNHVGNALELVVANLSAYLLVAIVNIRTHVL